MNTRDGISLDAIVDWPFDGGASIARIDDHTKWISPFEAGCGHFPNRNASARPWAFSTPIASRSRCAA